MRTTLDLDEKLIRKAMTMGHMHTKTELIHASLEAFIDRKRIDGLISMGGRTPLNLTRRQLRRMREDA
jgi:Arc/MetJ family transcription regulator